MRSDEFINFLLKNGKTDEEVLRIRESVPLGFDNCDKVVFARRPILAPYTKHVCVTGIRKTAFIKRLILTLSCLYDKAETCFFVLSPKTEYGELLRLHTIDVTVPYIRTKADLGDGMRCLEELMKLYESVRGTKKLFLVLDGLEEVEGCNQNGDLQEYRDFIDVVARKNNVEVISGVDLMKSIFSGYPGAYVGVGNCLVTTREDGKADVTYVGEDSTLSMPTPMFYPDSPSVTETVISLNAKEE
ncbi:MAG: hypothetical protein IJ996_06345 [Clostridia bacterium]|nr:hypothetical protein [Clostridia bacterium]